MHACVRALSLASARTEKQAAVIGDAAAPLDELGEPRAAAAPLAGGGGDQRRVRREEHARLQLLREAKAFTPAVEALAAVVHGHVNAKVAKVALRVVAQIGARGEPDVALPAAREVVEDDPRELPPLADTRSIAQKEPAARGRHDGCRRARGGARGHRGEVAVARQLDRLKLQVGQRALEQRRA